MRHNKISAAARSLLIGFMALALPGTKALAQPVVSALSTASGIPGTSVTITGTGFDGTAANDVVYFGGVRATVTSATTTALTVTVPYGGMYQPVSVLTTGTNLVGYSPLSFLPYYNNSAYAAGSINFDTAISFAATTDPQEVAIADIDGDGKPDLIATIHTGFVANVYHNTSSVGAVSSSSFSTGVGFTTGNSAFFALAQDMDGDGKLDLVVININDNTVAVLRNTATSGTISSGSFASRANFTTGTAPQGVAIGDIDGDGKPDIVVANGSANTISVFRNTSTSGTLSTSSFAAKVDFTTGPGPKSVSIMDMDGDGKPDVVVGNANSDSVSVFFNTATSGTISTSSLANEVEFLTGSNPYVAVADIDGDGKPDIVTGNFSSSTVSILRNTATSGSITTSSFAAKVDFATNASPEIPAIGDFDGDGKPDIVVPCINVSKLSILRNTATSGTITSSSFAAQVTINSPSHPSFVAIADVDSDGKADLLVANTNGGTISVFRNEPIMPTTGTASVCVGSTTTLSNGTSGGTWSSSNTATATVGSATGIVAGVAAGTAAITYKMFVGSVVTTVTVNPLPSAITGDLSFCQGTTSTLTDATTGGTWASGNTGVATAGSATGVVSGVSAGTVTITYTSAAGCVITATATVRSSLVTGAPTISSVSPNVGYPASTVTITGTNFDATATNDLVYFGATKAAVSAASSTSLTVAVPTGATYMPVTVENAACGLTGFEQESFIPDYDNSAFTAGIINLDPKSDISAGNYPFGVAIGDVDGDGKPDLVVTTISTNTISVFRNISTSGALTAGSFASAVNFTTGSAPFYVAIGDLDGDGKPDVAVSNSGSNTISVFRNTATSGTVDGSSFSAKTDFPVGNHPTGLAINDIDGDGRPDLIVSNRNDNTVGVLHNTATPGSFTSASFATGVNFAATNQPNILAVADIDGDGKPDIAVANWGASSVSVFRNTATAGVVNSSTFASAVDFTTGSGPYSLAVGDLDGDGKPEIVTANNGTSSISVLHNTATSGTIGSGTFATKVDFANSSVAICAGIADMDGDGKPDILVTVNGSSVLSVFRNTSTSGTINSSSFAARVSFATGTTPNIMAIGDLDGDGRPDVVVNNQNSQTISFFRNDPLGAITGTTSIAMCSGTATTTLGDIAADGTWTSTATTVATVGTTGVVTAVGIGTTTISYSLATGTVTTTVTVTGQPTITTVSPNLGYPASTVTITGTNFNTTAANNAVYFGATQATVATATTTSLTVSVPTGATYAQVTVDNTGCGLMSFEHYPYLPYYDNSAYVPGVINFDSRVDFSTGEVNTVAIGDLDGDGKPDLVITEPFNSIFRIYRNTSTSGSITSGSFASAVVYSEGGKPFGISIADVDGDGKPDLVFYDSTNTVSVFRNTATSGTIDGSSFAARLSFAIQGNPFTTNINFAAFPQGSVADMDGDGKPDIIACNYSSNSVSVLRNTSVAGSISFATHVDFATGSNPGNAAVLDIDGDGKPDIATGNSGTNSVSVLRNTSTPGTISSSSFATKVDFTTGSKPYVYLADIDGDGKPEIVTGNMSSGSVSVLRNTSTSGTITSGSFATKVDFGGGLEDYSLAVADIDGDGKPDLLMDPIGGTNIFVFRNTATSGTISSSSFASAVHVNVATDFYYHIAVGDLDGDGKPDIVASNLTGFFSILRNEPIQTITGTASVCIGSTTTLSSTPGGTWTSNTTAVATVGSTGIVTGVTAGTATIVYQMYVGQTTVTVTVNPLPAIATIGNNGPVCVGNTLNLSSTISGGSGTYNYSWAGPNTFTATTQNPAVTGVTTAASGVYTVVVTDGHGCVATGTNTTTVTVNTNPDAISGASSLVGCTTTTLADDTTGGTWSSSATSVAIVGSTGIVTGVSPGTAFISYTLGTGCFATQAMAVTGFTSITGATVTCPSQSVVLGAGSGGGTWSSSNSAVATIGSATGQVNGITSGTATITYSLGSTCNVTELFTVNICDPIVGDTVMCIGQSNTLTDASPGTWSSGNTTIATIGSADGVCYGVTGGFTIITYTYTTGGATYIRLSVNRLSDISGPSTVCAGQVIDLTESAGSGETWTSGNSGVASVAASSGVVTGVSAGTVSISYTMPTGCTAAISLTVYANAPVSGPSSVCTGQTVTFSDAVTGGAWSSSNPTLASISSAIATGLAAGTVYISYTTGDGCVSSAPLTVVASSAISGAGSVCTGQSIYLTNHTTGGLWATSDATVAAVGSSTGVVSGVAAGVAVVSYTLSSGCVVTASVTVAAMGAISGPTRVCVGQSMTLADTTAGGTWSSANGTVASIGSATGTTNGVAGGNTTISYTSTAGCTAIYPVTVTALPAISGSSVFCNTQSATFSDATTGGTWSSSNAAVVTAGSAGTITSVAAGTAVITYSLGTGCTVTYPITVNQVLPITGLASVCMGSTITLTDATTGGIWSSSVPTRASVGSVSGIVTGITAGTVNISYTANSCSVTSTITSGSIGTMSSNTGTYKVCVGQNVNLANSGPGGVWASSNTAMATVVANTGAVTGVGAGTATISYTIGTSCTATAVVTVNPLAAITGLASVCVGQTTTLADSTTAGTWTSGNTTKATIGSSSGIVTGIAGGTTNMSYTIAATGCRTVLSTFTVSQLSPIGGIMSVCQSAVQNLTDLYSGTWSSSNTGVATIGSANASVTGVAAGTTTITFVVNSNGCTATATFTVNPITAITGAGSVCTSSPITLTDGVSGGTWSSTNPTIASVGSLTGIVTGINPGHTTNITYSLSSGCKAVKSMSVAACREADGTENTNENPMATPSAAFSLVPNPNKGEFTITGQLGTTGDQEVAIAITNMLGQTVYAAKITATEGKINELIQLPNSITNGMYLVNLQSADGHRVFHMVVEQ